MLIDQWVEAHGQGSFDEGGAIAASGSLVPSLAEHYLGAPFFSANTRAPSTAAISCRRQKARCLWKTGRARSPG